jgi:hypothetical protein
MEISGSRQQLCAACFLERQQGKGNKKGVRN